MVQTRDNGQGPWRPLPMIPGARDPRNLTHREPGAVSGHFAGADIPPVPVPWLDELSAEDRAREGGAESRGRRSKGAPLSG